MYDVRMSMMSVLIADTVVLLTSNCPLILPDPSYT